MSLFSRILPDSPGVIGVCGRECTDGSPCQNMVDRPGDVCWIASHRDADPRVDDGPEDASAIPLSDLPDRAWTAVAAVGGMFGFALSWWFGLPRFWTNLLTTTTAILTLLAVALALNAYQRHVWRVGDDTRTN